MVSDYKEVNDSISELQREQFDLDQLMDLLVWSLIEKKVCSNSPKMHLKPLMNVNLLGYASNGINSVHIFDFLL